MYKFLFIFIISICVIFLIRRKDSNWVSALMALLLFFVVAFRGFNVGPDTPKYVYFFQYGSFASDTRDFEPFFQHFIESLRTLGLGGRAFLVVCAVLSLGLVLYTIWKKSPFKVFSIAMMLACFEWSFYLTGLRQSLAMGFFTFGVYLMQDFYTLQSFRDFSLKAQARTILGGIFLIMAVFMHNTALVGVLIFFLVYFFRPDERFYLIAIIASFVIALLGSFTSVAAVMETMFGVVEENMESADRYGGYIESKEMFDTSSMYLLLKDLLPLNVMSVICLLYNRGKKFTTYERMYFWVVVIADLFHSFFFMFRIRMYLFPMAAIAIASLMMPVLQEDKENRKRALYVATILLLIAYVILCGYTSYVNLTAQRAYEYTLF